MPLYGELARYYDLLMGDVDYEGWVEYLEDIFKKYGYRPRRVLEIACGTGNISNILARKGYEVIASDISEDMLAVAQAKALDTGVRVTYIQQDMRNIQLASPVDCVLCICDGINYILNERELRKVFKGVYGALKKQGLFIFDISSRYKLENIIGNNTFGESREDISYLWENYYDPESRTCEFNLTYFVKEKDNLYRKYQDVHIQRAYLVEELEGLLKECGFTVKGIYEAFTYKKPNPTSERINFISIGNNN